MVKRAAPSRLVDIRAADGGLGRPVRSDISTNLRATVATTGYFFHSCPGYADGKCHCFHNTVVAVTDAEYPGVEWPYCIGHCDTCAHPGPLSTTDLDPHADA